MTLLCLAPACRRRHPQRGAPPPPSLNPLLNGPDAMRRSALALPPPHRQGPAKFSSQILTA